MSKITWEARDMSAEHRAKMTRLRGLAAEGRFAEAAQVAIDSGDPMCARYVLEHDARAHPFIARSEHAGWRNELEAMCAPKPVSMLEALRLLGDNVNERKS